MPHYQLFLHNDPLAAAVNFFINAITGLSVDGVTEV